MFSSLLRVSIQNEMISHVPRVKNCLPLSLLWYLTVVVAFWIEQDRSMP